MPVGKFAPRWGTTTKEKSVTDNAEGTTATAPEQPAAEAPKAEAPAEQPPAEKPDEGDGELHEGGIKALRAEREARKALEKQVAELQPIRDQMTALAKVFGGQEDDAPPDPAKIAEELSSTKARTGDLERDLGDARRDLAIYQAASGVANASALLDSLSFRESVKGIDPADGEAITAAIQKAVEKNPAYALSKPGPRPDPSQGVQGAPASLDAQIAEAEKAGNTREVIRLKARRLAAPQN